MIEQFDSVTLTRDIPEEGLKAGDIGIAVDIYGNHEAYHVEFVATNGWTAALLLLNANDVTRVKTDERQYRHVEVGDIPHLALTPA